MAWEPGIAGREGLSEPEAESRSWAGDKTPVKMGVILNAVSEIYQHSARKENRGGDPMIGEMSWGANTYYLLGDPVVFIWEKARHERLC